MTQPDITDQVIGAFVEAYRVSLASHTPSDPPDQTTTAIRAGLAAAAPHIAAQALRDAARNLDHVLCRDCADHLDWTADYLLDGHPGSSAPMRTEPAERRYVIVRTRPGIDGMTVTNVGGIAYRDRESAQAAADVLRRVADVTEGHEDQGATLTVHLLAPATL